MKKKLIEVALPLEAINRESAREKSIRHGHPSTLHLWWARRPLAACRAILFASLVDDPSSRPDEFPTEEEQNRERKRLFELIEELVKWDNSNNEDVLNAARKEILKSTDGNPPPVLDPFCGGGSIPLEAQRLGLEAHASDLNPVAVLITKALIEIPPKFANRPPVNPEARLKLTHSAKWKAAQGLAEDVRHYGKWMRDEAEKRIGHLYPKVKLENGREATVIAWLWARTVKCANPACDAEMPLVRSFALSTKRGKEVRIEPESIGAKIRFRIRSGITTAGTKMRGEARCLVCGTSINDAQLRVLARRAIGSQLLAAVVEGKRNREYVEADRVVVPEVRTIDGSWLQQAMPENARWFSPPMYGLKEYRDLFTPRQLVALTTFSDLVGEARERVLADAMKGNEEDDGVRLADGGAAATAYADAVATYLAFGVDKMADTNSSLCSWQVDPPRLRATFGRQAIPMVWDFAESNPFGGAAGDFELAIKSICEVLDRVVVRDVGAVTQIDATTIRQPAAAMVCTDPPYYDNIGYADLSDYFYVWLRKALSDVYPQICSTLLVPKAQELIASPYRFHGDADDARQFFETGLTRVFAALRNIQIKSYPLTIFYAFKQSEEAEDNAVVSTGWETMLEGLLNSAFVIHGTWPIRSEMATRNVGRGTNALASSVVLVARPRSESATIANRKEFIAALKGELPDALKKLRHSNIAAVDLAQAAIGPGMAVFSRYAKVIEADGSSMRVRSALQLINQALDEVLSEQESEYDADTQWAVAWFSDNAMDEGPYGAAETLSRAKNTSVEGMTRAGVVDASKGKVRLVARESLAADWDPTNDGRLTIWEVTQHLIRRLHNGGEQRAAELLRKVGAMGEIARDLAYRLYSICERKGWADDALAYNALVVAWPEISRLAGAEPATSAAETQMRLG